MKTRKVVINKCYGGFGLSHKAVMRYAELKGMTLYPWIDEITRRYYKTFEEAIKESLLLVHYSTTPVKKEDQSLTSKNNAKNYWYHGDISRTDPVLIQLVEEYGEAVNGKCAKLKIVEIPSDVEWSIEDYDGNEWVAEKHRRWD